MFDFGETEIGWIKGYFILCFHLLCLNSLNNFDNNVVNACLVFEFIAAAFMLIGLYGRPEQQRWITEKDERVGHQSYQYSEQCHISSSL